MSESYSAEFAEVYELLYRSRGKDWTAEAVELARLIRARRPEADSILDLACGTGAHLAAFSALFGRAAGVELSEPMRQVAKTRSPRATIHSGDMRTFELDHRFDAISCMFSSIGYLRDVAELRSTIARWVRHLLPGGVLVVEPWWTPERFIDGYVAADVGRDGHRSVTRLSHSRRAGRTVHMDVRFVAADAGGIVQFDESHALTLFTMEEYLQAFELAGCRITHLDGYLTDCGILIGIREV